MSTTTVAIHDCQVACEQDANCNGYVYLPALKKCFKPTKNDAVQTAHGGGHQSGKKEIENKMTLIIMKLYRKKDLQDQLHGNGQNV